MFQALNITRSINDAKVYERCSTKSNDHSAMFETIITSVTAITQFSSFLRKEQSLENLNFFMSAESFKELFASNDGATISETASRLFAQFFDLNSSQALNLDCMTRSTVCKLIEAKEYRIDMFNEAQMEVKRTLVLDLIPRFLTSKEYQNMMGCIENDIYQEKTKQIQNARYKRRTARPPSPRDIVNPIELGRSFYLSRFQAGSISPMAFTNTTHPINEVDVATPGSKQQQQQNQDVHQGADAHNQTMHITVEGVDNEGELGSNTAATAITSLSVPQTDKHHRRHTGNVLFCEVDNDCDNANKEANTHTTATTKLTRGRRNTVHGSKAPMDKYVQAWIHRRMEHPTEAAWH